jgi:hypothetical protein
MIVSTAGSECAITALVETAQHRDGPPPECGAVTAASELAYVGHVHSGHPARSALAVTGAGLKIVIMPLPYPAAPRLQYPTR